MAALAADEDDMDEELTPEQQADLAAIRQRKKQLVRQHRLKKAAGNNNPVLPAKFDRCGTDSRREKRRAAGGMRHAAGAGACVLACACFACPYHTGPSLAALCARTDVLCARMYSENLCLF